MDFGVMREMKNQAVGCYGKNENCKFTGKRIKAKIAS